MNLVNRLETRRAPVLEYTDETDEERLYEPTVPVYNELRDAFNETIKGEPDSDPLVLAGTLQETSDNFIVALLDDVCRKAVDT